MSDEIKTGYLRTTTPLSIFNDFSKINPVVLHKACERGTKIHRYAELHMLNSYFPDPDSDLLGYLNSFRRWYDTMVAELISTETRYYDDMLRVTGAIDIVAVLKNDKTPTIIDIKTGSVKSLTWDLQLAMYRQLYNIQKNTKVKAERRIVIQLNKDGKFPKVHEYTKHEHDLKIYLGVLQAYRYFND